MDRDGSRRSFRRHGAAGCACRRNPEFLPPVALAFFCPVRGNEGDVRSRTTRQEHCTYERHPRLTQTVGGSRVNVRFRVSPLESCRSAIGQTRSSARDRTPLKRTCPTSAKGQKQSLRLSRCSPVHWSEVASGRFYGPGCERPRSAARMHYRCSKFRKSISCSAQQCGSASVRTETVRSAGAVQAASASKL